MQFTSSYVPENRSDDTDPDVHQAHQDGTSLHYERIERELREAGMSWFGLWLTESQYLSRLIHENESIKGVTYGWQSGGIVMLIATDQRIIFLDKNTFFHRDDEVNYGDVRGIRYYPAGLASTIVLHTQARDFIVRTYNKASLKKFIDYIDLHGIVYMDEEDVRDD
ncbi:MAG: PH domain-containing protein [Candidatus Saccharimonadales bacterium]